MVGFIYPEEPRGDEGSLVRGPFASLRVNAADMLKFNRGRI